LFDGVETYLLEDGFVGGEIAVFSLKTKNFTHVGKDVKWMRQEQISYYLLYRVRPKKRRNPHLRHPWLDLTKTKTVIIAIYAPRASQR
jgi:hypothetical protein